MRHLWIVIAVGVWPLHLAAQQSTAVPAVDAITTEVIQHRINTLAHDSMAGRDTPSPELEQAASWIASEFAGFGLVPGGDDGSYIQRYEIRQTLLDVERSEVVVSGGPAWRFGTDVVHAGGARSLDGTRRPVTVLSGQVVAPDAGSLGLAGRAVVVHLPTTPDGRLAPPSQQILQRIVGENPAFIVMVAEVSEAIWDRYVTQQQRVASSLPWRTGTAPPILLVRPATARGLLEGAGDVWLTATIREEIADAARAPNVVGILPGSDPVLRHEYVVFSAHMDHVGVAGRGTGCTAIGADSICNGADDNASGTAVVMTLAEAMSLHNPRPRRSIIFLLVSGEEKGLWGSDYFAGHPPVLQSQLVANINADMVGRNWTDTIVVIGKEHSDMGATLERVSARHPELNMEPIDDLWPQQRFFFRSDHYNFARRGVPALFFFSGVHEDYHRPGDQPEKIDAEKTSRVARLIFHVALEIANADEKPRWNPESYQQIVEVGR